jgi:hypothetical protein
MKRSEKYRNTNLLTPAVCPLEAISDSKYIKKSKIMAVKTRNFKKARNINGRTTKGTDAHNFAERQAS